MITPQQIQELAEPIEEIYAKIVDELLANIGRHVRAPTWTHTAAWEIQKLAEMGQLTEENAAIINRWIKEIPATVRQTMEATRAAALDRLEKQMEQAVAGGHLTLPVADSTARVLEDLSAQAVDKLNLVNTTMLQSSLDQYQRAVILTADDVRRAEATQAILNEAAGSVATGAETRTQALQRALKQISDEGLTGFIDRAGRHWTPEAYVNMDIRTTVHNTAIEATRARMEDFGTDVFQVSSHAGARPGCYPYQGRFYSWGNRYGTIELGNGKTVDYEPLNVTSYGEPAGLFGINCGHYTIPVVPGVTIPHGADNIQPKEENDKAYAESQEQRRIEREIREAKRVVAMEGDLATEKDKQRVKDLQAEMRGFIDRTGRTRRYDREAVGNSRNDKQAQSGPMLHTYHDPMREKMGSAFDSHPREIEKMLKSLEQKGVDVVYRDGSMGYSPSIIGGNPGRLIMDKAASYSAWLHEMKHVSDDEASGWQGMLVLMTNPAKAAEYESAAYQIEIDFAKENGYSLIARRLERLRFERRQELLGSQRGNKQNQK